MCLHGYPQLVAVALAPCHRLNQGCKRFLKRFHASCQQNKTLFDTVFAGFLYMLMIHQKVARQFRVLTASSKIGNGEWRNGEWGTRNGGRGNGERGTGNGERGISKRGNL